MSHVITQEIVKELFDYHPDGYLVNKVTRGRVARAGKRTCKEEVKNYRQVRLFGKSLREHVLIFLYHHGYLPKLIDHIDGNRFNNKIENLQPISHKENIRKTTRGAFYGVRYHSGSGKWRAKITVDDKSKHLGCFNCFGHALSARRNGEKFYWR
jgi:hypothetical protein